MKGEVMSNRRYLFEIPDDSLSIEDAERVWQDAMRADLAARRAALIASEARDRWGVKS